ncbi:MAG: flagellin B [Helicobacteraceae bacterium]|nr:flagellin B [Helicobacteraceae bacterium]
MEYFRINTNVTSLRAQANTNYSNMQMDDSLVKLSSGLRINSAADDPAGMLIADALRSQASSLGQAVSNANSGNSMLTIADKAMQEQISILDSIKIKATQAAQDGQTSDTRDALQQDISKLISSLDEIAETTSYNGKALLSGSFTNKEFQIGAYANQDIMATIDPTSSDKIGNTRFETSSNISESGTAQLLFANVDGSNDITLQSVIISTSAGTGVGVLSQVINTYSESLDGIKASFVTQSTGSSKIAAGTLSDFYINGISISGSLTIEENDSDGSLISAINNETSSTGVSASSDTDGKLELTSADGRAIQVSGTNVNSLLSLGSDTHFNAGRLTLTRLGADDIQVSDSNNSSVGTAINSTNIKETSMNLREMTGSISASEAEAMGYYANENITTQSEKAGVGTLQGAMSMMSIADSARESLDKILAGIGSTQNQFTSTINNISMAQVNVTSAESQIRDVDFAAESANFTKYNILSQAGSFAISQANVSQESVLNLLKA